MTATGTRGKLKVGFQTAVELRDWQLTHIQETIGVPYADLISSVRNLDRFLITRKPTEVGLWMGQAWWVWEDFVASVSDTQVEVRLQGAPTARTSF